MKRIPRDPLRFDGFGLFATYGAKQRISLREQGALRSFTDELSRAAERELENPSFLHGQRTEALFERIVAALGTCLLIKREDAGEVFHQLDAEIRVPDFRLLLQDRTQLLVEVKNFHQKGAPRKELRERAEYLDSLVGYASAMGCEFRIAVYWSQWNQWTLLKPSAFRTEGDWRVVSLAHAMLANEMHLVGDELIGTRWPLRFRSVADPSRERRVVDGVADFTIRSAEIYSGLEELTSPPDRALALFLAFHGDWQILRTVAEADDDGALLGVVLELGPSEQGRNRFPDFDFVGYLSGMISKQHKDATASLHNIRAEFEPGAIKTLLSAASKALPLWRFRITTRDEDGRGGIDR